MKIPFVLKVSMNIWKNWKAKLESAYSFMLKCCKITVRGFFIFTGAKKGLQFILEYCSVRQSYRDQVLQTLTLYCGTHI